MGQQSGLSLELGRSQLTECWLAKSAGPDSRSLERSGRARARLKGGICAIFENCQRILWGGSRATADRIGPKLPDTKRCRETPQPDEADQCGTFTTGRSSRCRKAAEKLESRKSQGLKDAFTVLLFHSCTVRLFTLIRR